MAFKRWINFAFYRRLAAALNETIYKMKDRFIIAERLKGKKYHWVFHNIKTVRTNKKRISTSLGEAAFKH